MADLSQAQLEKQAGDLLERRRLVDSLLNGVYDEIVYGPLEVRHATALDGGLMAEDPDGGTHIVGIPDSKDPERIEEVEYRLRDAWEDWLDEL